MNNKSLVLAHIATIRQTVEEEQRATRARTQKQQQAVVVLRLAVDALCELTTDSAHAEELVREEGGLRHLGEFLAREAYPLLQIGTQRLLVVLLRHLRDLRAVPDEFLTSLLPRLLTNLLSTDLGVQDTAVEVVGQVTQQSVSARDRLLELSVLPALLKTMGERIEVGRLRRSSTVLRVLCTTKPFPRFDQLRPIVPMLGKLLQHEDAEVLHEICQVIIAMGSKGTDEELREVIESENVASRLVALLSRVEELEGLDALQALGQLVRGANKQTILDRGVLSMMSALLAHPGTCTDALFFLSNIAGGSTEQIEQIFAADLIPVVVRMVPEQSMLVRKEALGLLANAILGGSPRQRARLIDQGCIRLLCDFLVATNTHPPKFWYALDALLSGGYSGTVPVRVGFAQGDNYKDLPGFPPTASSVVRPAVSKRVLQTFFVTKAAAFEVCAAWDRAAAESVLHDIVVSGLADKRYMGTYSSVPLRDPTMRGSAPQYRRKGTTTWLLRDLNGHWVVTDDPPSVGSIEYRSRIRSSHAVPPGTLPGNAGPWLIYWPTRKQWTTYKPLTVTTSENMVPPLVD